MSNQVDASEGGFNLNVIVTEMVDTMTTWLWKAVLEFPSLTEWILSWIAPYGIMLSMAFGLFILWYFIMLKTFPDWVWKLWNVPWLDGLNMLKWKDWKTFWIQFLIVSFAVFLFLWKWIWWYSVDWNMWWTVKNIFVWNPTQWWTSILKEEKATQDYVDVIIKPLEWIRFTGYRYDNSWQIIDVATTKTDSSYVINGAKCLYDKIDNLGSKSLADTVEEKWKPCVYPNQKQAMLIVDSFSTQVNTLKSRPVPLYIVNNYDGVTKTKNGQKEWFDFVKSVREQNETHAIVSFLKNQNNQLEWKWTNQQVVDKLLEFLVEANDFFTRMVSEDKEKEEWWDTWLLPYKELATSQKSALDQYELYKDLLKYTLDKETRKDTSDETKTVLRSKLDSYLNSSVIYFAYQSDTAVDIITAKFKKWWKTSELNNWWSQLFSNFRSNHKWKRVSDVIYWTVNSQYTYDLKNHFNFNARLSVREVLDQPFIDSLYQMIDNWEFAKFYSFLEQQKLDTEKQPSNIVDAYQTVFMMNYNKKYENMIGNWLQLFAQHLDNQQTAAYKDFENRNKQCTYEGSLAERTKTFFARMVFLDEQEWIDSSGNKHKCSAYSWAATWINGLMNFAFWNIAEMWFASAWSVLNLEAFENENAKFKNEEFKAITKKIAQISNLIVQCHTSMSACWDVPSEEFDTLQVLWPSIKILQDNIDRERFIENFSSFVWWDIEQWQNDRINNVLSYFNSFGELILKNTEFLKPYKDTSFIHKVRENQLLEEAKETLRTFAEKKVMSIVAEKMKNWEDLSWHFKNQSNYYTQFDPSFFKLFGEKQFEKFASNVYMDATNYFHLDNTPSKWTRYYNGVTAIWEWENEIYWIWNDAKRKAEAEKWVTRKTLENILWAWEDISYVWINNNSKHKNGVELSIGDIIFASPWTTIYALPYPVKLRMNAEMAQTIEFLDRKGWITWTYWNRFDSDGNLKTKWTNRIVWEIYSGWVYYTVSSIFGTKSINWTFNPLYWFGVSEMAGWNMFLIMLTNFVITPWIWIYKIFSFFFYFISFLFPVFGLWLLIVDWKLNKIGKYLLALFLAFASTPLWGYLIMGLYWLSFSWDDASQYALRNFAIWSSSLMLIVLAYVPLLLTLFFYKFLIDWLIKGKVNIGTMVWSWVIYWQGSAWWALMGKIRWRWSKWKDKDKNSNWDWTDDNSSSSRDKKSYNNDYTGRWVGNTVQNSAFEVNNDDILKQFETKWWPWEYVSQDVNWNDIFRRIDFENKYKATDEETEALRQSQIQDGKFLAMKDDWDIDELAEMNKIWRVNSRELLTLFEIYKQGMENWMSKWEFARSMNVIYKDHQEKFRKLLETLEEVEKAKWKNPEFNKKLERAKNTLTERDVKFIKELEKKNGGILNRENLKREFSLLTNSLKDWSWLNFETLNKTQAITSYMNLLEKSKEEQFEMMSKALENTLGNSMKNNSRWAELQRRIASMVANWDFNWLKDLENLNKDVDGLADYIRKVQTVPSEMMKVLHAQLDAKQLSSSADGINKFLWMMKNNAEIEKLKFEDVNRYLAVTKEINEFRQADMQKKISMATKAAIWSSDAQMKAIKNSEQITKKLTEEILFTMENQWVVTNQSLNSMVEAFDITARDKKIIKDRLKDKLNTIKELNG